jgi:putative glutathione S-transferase
VGSYVAEAGVHPGQQLHRTRITADGRDGYPVQPDRHRLIVARACP